MNTGDLYTGTTSGSFGTNKAVKKQRDEFKKAKQDLQNVILPSHKQLIADIDAEIERHYALAINLAKVYQTDDEARFRMAALSMFVDYLNQLKTKYQSVAKGAINE